MDIENLPSVVFFDGNSIGSCLRPTCCNFFSRSRTSKLYCSEKCRKKMEQVRYNNLEYKRSEIYMKNGAFTTEDKILLPKNNAIGVYFLVLHDEIVYVGMSKCNLFSRIASHSGKIEFDTVWYKNFEICDVGEMEAMYIRKYKPRYNKTVPPGG